jgi:hypothetical protein
MRRIEWEKMPKPLKLFLLPLLPILGMLGWIMNVVGEEKQSCQVTQTSKKFKVFPVLIEFDLDEFVDEALTPEYVFKVVKDRIGGKGVTFTIGKPFSRNEKGEEC